LTSIKVNNEESISAASMSVNFELISGLPCKGALKKPINGELDVVINETFVIALND